MPACAPERVAQLVNLEGFGLRGNDAGAGAGAATPSGSTNSPRRRGFATTRASQTLAARLQQENPRLERERALFLAEHWGAATPDGRVALRSDPAHKRVNPVLYRIEEAEACWRG